MVIDGLGEIHLDYPPALLDQIRASGVRGCVITLGNPALQGPSAHDSATSELAAYPVAAPLHAAADRQDPRRELVSAAAGHDRIEKAASLALRGRSGWRSRGASKQSVDLPGDPAGDVEPSQTQPCLFGQRIGHRHQQQCQEQT